MRFIGDVHGKYKPYKKIIAACENSIQVGDLGVGFRRYGGWRDGAWMANPPHYAMQRGNHRFIRGNHDNPGACRNHSQWIRDGHIENNIMFIGGAVSVDREWRQEGYDWWADEELSMGELYDLMDKYLLNLPEVMVTHDCPEEIATIMCAVSGRRKMDWPSRSRQAFQSMWEKSQPRIWCYGHWHTSFDQVINGTRFICLAELEYKDLDL